MLPGHLALSLIPSLSLSSFRSQTPSLTFHERNSLLSSSGAFCLRQRRQSRPSRTPPCAAWCDVLWLKHEVIRFCANCWHSFSSWQPSCCVSSSEVLAPAAEFGDVARLGGGMRFAEKAFDLCAILDLDIADRERWGYSGQKTA